MIHWFLLSIFIAESITPMTYHPSLIGSMEFKTEAECLKARDNPVMRADYRGKDQLFCIAAAIPSEEETVRLREPIACNGDLCSDHAGGHKDCKTGRPCLEKPRRLTSRQERFRATMDCHYNNWDPPCFYKAPHDKKGRWMWEPR